MSTPFLYVVRGMFRSACCSARRSMSTGLSSLSGLKVLELGQLIAGPFATRVLADHGADVIKIEPPDREGRSGGDPLRQWRVVRDGTSIWWSSIARNKRSVTLDIRVPDDRDRIRELIDEADICVENFRPGFLESMGLDYENLSKTNKGLILCRVSGYGQSGPLKDSPGFAAVAEAMGGLRYLTAEPGRMPVRCGVSLGDTLAALHGVIGILLALQARNASVCDAHPKGVGQVVDVALYESVFNCMESLISEYSVLGVSREPSGAALPGIAPSNSYNCSNGIVLVAGNGDSIFKRLMLAIGRNDLANDPGLCGNAGRVARVTEIDGAIAAWTQLRTVNDVLSILNAADVPVGKIFSAEDIAKDSHYRARNMVIEEKTRSGVPILVPGIVPHLSRTPGKLRLPAPHLGEHTADVLQRTKKIT